jgi:hypothetical protein
MANIAAGFIRRRVSAIGFTMFFAVPMLTCAQVVQPPPETTRLETGQENQSSLLTPLKPQNEDARYHPIIARQRFRWFITNTVGPLHLAGGAFTSAFATAVDRPKEYGPGWVGFGKRNGMRLTGISTGNAIEASAGALWGEDPRYFRVPERSFGARVRNVVKLTFVSRRRDGRYGPAYARFLAVSGNNFLSNIWRADSEANNHDAVLRSVEGLAGRMAANTFEEFWPDVKRHFFHRNP